MAKHITNPERHIISAAFRQMARGVGPKAAYASTVEFYRARRLDNSGHDRQP